MKKGIHIGIGGCYASCKPVVINTLLGSCVAVCLFDPVARIGGMNHIFLPGKAELKDFNMASRYGVNAMELLINRIMNLGGRRNRLSAKVFGGAHLLSPLLEEDGVGRKNAEFVRIFLQTEKIRIINGDLGGNDGRKIYFHTDTGEVLLRRVKKTMQKDITRKENELLRKVAKEMKQPGFSPYLFGFKTWSSGLGQREIAMPLARGSISDLKLWSALKAQSYIEIQGKAFHK